MTLRMDTRLNYHPEEPKQQLPQQQQQQQQSQQQPLSLPPVLQQPYHRQNGHSNHQTNGVRETPSQQSQHRQITLDYGMFTNDTLSTNGVENNYVENNYVENTYVESQNSESQNGDIQRATRVPTGHQRRDRASLRAKHKQEMEKQQHVQKMSQASSRY
jgi:hypothetical protein